MAQNSHFMGANNCGAFFAVDSTVLLALRVSSPLYMRFLNMPRLMPAVLLLLISSLVFSSGFMMDTFNGFSTTNPEPPAIPIDRAMRSDSASLSAAYVSASPVHKFLTRFEAPEASSQERLLAEARYGADSFTVQQDGMVVALAWQTRVVPIGAAFGASPVAVRLQKPLRASALGAMWY